jgi:hypothetical protein
VLGEVPQPSVHRCELRFEVGDRLADMHWGPAHLATLLARALAQRGYGECEPTCTMLEPVALELRA